MEQGICQLVGLACSQCSRQLRVWALIIALRLAGYFFRSRETKRQVTGTVGIFIFHSLPHVVNLRYMYSSQAGEPVNSFLGSLLNHDTVSRFIKGEERRQVF